MNSFHFNLNLLNQSQSMGNLEKLSVFSSEDGPSINSLNMMPHAPPPSLKSGSVSPVLEKDKIYGNSSSKSWLSFDNISLNELVDMPDSGKSLISKDLHFHVPWEPISSDINTPNSLLSELSIPSVSSISKQEIMRQPIHYDEFKYIIFCILVRKLLSFINEKDNQIPMVLTPSNRYSTHDFRESEYKDIKDGFLSEYQSSGTTTCGTATPSNAYCRINEDIRSLDASNENFSADDTPIDITFEEMESYLLFWRSQSFKEREVIIGSLSETLMGLATSYTLLNECNDTKIQNSNVLNLPSILSFIFKYFVIVWSESFNFVRNPSIGSVAHDHSMCKPCVFANKKNKTCKNGFNCCYCHFAHKERRRGKRNKKMNEASIKDNSIQNDNFCQCVSLDLSSSDPYRLSNVYAIPPPPPPISINSFPLSTLNGTSDHGNVSKNRNTSYHVWVAPPPPPPPQKMEGISKGLNLNAKFLSWNCNVMENKCFPQDNYFSPFTFLNSYSEIFEQKNASSNNANCWMGMSKKKFTPDNSDLASNTQFQSFNFDKDIYFTSTSNKSEKPNQSLYVNYFNFKNDETQPMKNLHPLFQSNRENLMTSMF